MRKLVGRCRAIARVPENWGPYQAKNARRRAFTATFTKACGAVLAAAYRRNHSSGDTLDGVARGVFASRPHLGVQRGSGGMNSSSCSSAPQRSTDGGGGPRVPQPLSRMRGLEEVSASSGCGPS